MIEAITQELDARVLQDCDAHAKRKFPEEACGLLFRNRISGRIDCFEPVSNIQNDLHRLDSQRYPRDARQAYTMDDREVVALQRRYLPTHEIAGIFHSHANVGVYFSEEDRSQAAPWGEPLFPELFYLVWGIRDGQTEGAAIYSWNPNQGTFDEQKLSDVIILRGANS